MARTITQRIVLLAEDDPLVRNLVRRSLETAGFLVLVAADAGEALVLSRACPERINVLLLDVELAGMDGITLSEKITQDRKDALVLFMSAGTTRSIPEGKPFLSKPFSLTELIATLEEMLAAQH